MTQDTTSPGPIFVKSLQDEGDAKLKRYTWSSFFRKDGFNAAIFVNGAVFSLQGFDIWSRGCDLLRYFRCRLIELWHYGQGVRLSHANYGSPEALTRARRPRTSSAESWSPLRTRGRPSPTLRGANKRDTGCSEASKNNGAGERARSGFRTCMPPQRSPTASGQPPLPLPCCNAVAPPVASGRYRLPFHR